jgi:tetratricopeptide (TPR) repeat protein
MAEESESRPVITDLPDAIDAAEKTPVASPARPDGTLAVDREPGPDAPNAPVVDNDRAPPRILLEPEVAAPVELPKIVPGTLLHVTGGEPSFGDALSGVVQKMSEARDNVSAAQARMDLATLHLKHGHYAEALSSVDRIEPAYLNRKQREDLASLRAVSEVMAPVRAVIDTPYVFEDPAYDAWPDQILWRTMHAIRSAKEVDSAALEQSFDILDRHYPEVYKSDVYPYLLEAALSASQWGTAKRIATVLAERPELQKGSSYDFLIGLAAYKAERMLDAYDAYRKAALGSDVYAQRARIGLVQIGLETETMSAEDAESILEDHRYSWRGDGYEVDLLLKLADLKLARGDRPGTMLALGQVFTRYPEDPAAEAAEAVARGLLNAFYKEGTTEEISLPEFMSGHRTIEPVYHFVSGFEDYHVAFADHLLDRGLTLAAAQEFGTAAEYLQVAKDLGLWEIDAIKLHGLRLRRAEAEWAGGQAALAAITLAPIKATGQAGFDDKVNTLRAEVFSALDNPDEVVATAVELRTPRYVRMLAEAFFTKGDWDEAVRHYGELRAEHGEAYEAGDAISHVLAAYRAEDLEAMLPIVEAFPEIMQSAAWGEVAAGLSQEPASIKPLSDANVRSRIAQAEASMASVRAATAGAEPDAVE